MAVIKIGGSLIRYKEKIVKDLLDFSEKNREPIIMVPGGGPSLILYENLK